MPAANTTQLKKTVLRFMTADRLSRPPEAPPHSLMTVGHNIEPRQVDNLPKATAISHIPSQTISRGASNSTWNKRPPYNSYHSRQPRCMYCRRFGRRAWRCGHNRPRNPGEPHIYHLSSCHVNHISPTTLKGRVQGVEIDILLDTGASVSLIKEAFLKRLHHKVQQKRCSSALITASGDPLKVCYKTELDLTMERCSVRHEFLVCPTLTWDMILGVDFMLKHQVSIFMDRSEAKIGEVTVRLHQYAGTSKPVTHIGILELVRQVESNQIIQGIDRRATVAVLRQFSSVFEESISRNRTNTVQHSIFTGDHMAIRQPPRRVPVHYRPQLESMIKDMLDNRCEAVPIPQQDALTVARAFIDHRVSRYGAPLSLHSDRGTAFESHLITEICKLLGIRKTHATAYHPEGNGLVERTNRTIKAILQSFISRSSSELWDEVLPQCMLAYRTSVHGSTGFSPAILLFGHELRLPVEIQSPLLPYEEQEYIPYIRTLRNRLADAYRLVNINSRKATNRQKEVYDRQMQGPVYKVGDRVWLRHPMTSIRSYSKFHQLWHGPFEIVLIRSPTTVVLRNPQRPQDDVITVHYNQIKPDRMTVPTDAQFTNPPPATSFYDTG
ncbi:unnamed protein product [Schistosoma spindalis]|nr:unnamed protein product [Schistosoma spindale]